MKIGAECEGRELFPVRQPLYFTLLAPYICGEIVE
jgi:hypothetical protein